VAEVNAQAVHRDLLPSGLSLRSRSFVRIHRELAVDTIRIAAPLIKPETRRGLSHELHDDAIGKVLRAAPVEESLLG
jgi:hypothetical protein